MELIIWVVREVVVDHRKPFSPYLGFGDSGGGECGGGGGGGFVTIVVVVVVVVAVG